MPSKAARIVLINAGSAPAPFLRGGRNACRFPPASWHRWFRGLRPSQAYHGRSAQAPGPFQPLILAQHDRLRHFIKLGTDMLAQLVETFILPRIIPGALGNFFELSVHRRKRRPVGSKVAFFAGQQIAALSGFRILKLGQQALERNDGAVRFDNALIGKPEALKIDIGDQPADDKNISAAASPIATLKSIPNSFPERSAVARIVMRNSCSGAIGG